MTGFLRSTFAELAPFLVDYGYSPVPIYPGAKAPLIDDWQADHPPSHYLPRCADWGTGILTAHCPAVDLDIRHKELVRVLLRLAGDMLGPSPFRVGEPPKVVMPFSTAEPFDKISGKWWALPGEDWRSPDYVPHRIEVLASGQQYVSYARHPRGTFYRWCRGEPMDTLLVDLPEIDEHGAVAFVDTAEQVLIEFGAVPLRRRDRIWFPDIGGEAQTDRRRSNSNINSDWQLIDPETLAKAIDAKHASRLRAGAWICSCPAHTSQGHRSLSITPREGGGSVVYCFAECDFVDIARAVADIVGRRAA